jgi:hypothetical protein
MHANVISLVSVVMPLWIRFHASFRRLVYKSLVSGGSVCYVALNLSVFRFSSNNDSKLYSNRSYDRSKGCYRHRIDPITRF